MTDIRTLALLAASLGLFALPAHAAQPAGPGEMPDAAPAAAIPPPPPDATPPEEPTAPPPPFQLPAAGLDAALAAHHKRTNGLHGDPAHDAAFGRGYGDGLYGGAYDNRGDAEPYHEGFFAGEAERSNRRAANSTRIRAVPVAVLQSCIARGEAYLETPPNSAVPVGIQDYGQGNFEVVVASGYDRARCTVDASGRVSGVGPF